MHAKEDVATAYELALDKNLRDSGPASKLFYALAKFRVIKDVPSSILNICGSKTQRGVGVWVVSTSGCAGDRRMY